MSLNLEQLRTFALVSQSGSFSGAAARLGISQPAVSLQIKQLELLLRIKLLERVGKRAKPTAAGHELLTHGQRVQSAVDGLLTAMASHSGEVVGRVTIGTGATACLHFLPHALRALRARFPNLSVLVRTGNTVDFVQAVEDTTLDLALVTLPVRSRAIAAMELLDDEFVAICPPRMRLGSRVTPRMLAEKPLVLFEPAANTRALIDNWFRTAELRIQPVMELGSIEAIKGMVASGLGCSIVPRMAMSGGERSVQVARLAPRLGRKLAIIMRRDKPVNRALRQVVEALQQQALSAQAGR